MKTINVVPITKLTPNANVINSHVLYKIKHNDDNSLKLKARISLHGNDDAIKNELTKDCTSFPPNRIRTVQSLAKLKGWNLFWVM